MHDRAGKTYNSSIMLYKHYRLITLTIIYSIGDKFGFSKLQIGDRFGLVHLNIASIRSGNGFVSIIVIVATRKGHTSLDYFTQILPLHVKPLRRNVTRTLQGQATKIGIILIMIDSGHRMYECVRTGVLKKDSASSVLNVRGPV